MELKTTDKLEVKTVIIAKLGFVALIYAIDKHRDLQQEYADFCNRTAINNGHTFYQQFVMTQCILNIDEVSHMLIATMLTDLEVRDIKRQLTGIILMLNPQVYDEALGWDW